MKQFLEKLYRFSSSWTGTIIIVLFLIFFVVQSFVIPSGSMKRSLLIGDFLFAKKFSYGIPTPHMPWLEIPLLPDFNNNGHLIEGERPKRGDIVIFRYPKNQKIHYVKRCVAVGGDEVIYTKKLLLIHHHEGDDYIRAHFQNHTLLTINNKLWVANPYSKRFKGISYNPEITSVYRLMLAYRAAHEPLGMKPINLNSLPTETLYIAGEEINGFYTKVSDDCFFMMGDNRDNSNDSRFWGEVPYRLVVGKPWFIYMSLETRSYQHMLHGDKNHNGQDHRRLSEVCANLSLESSECEQSWEKERFRIRWNRIGNFVESLQLQSPKL